MARDFCTCKRLAPEKTKASAMRQALIPVVAGLGSGVTTAIFTGPLLLVIVILYSAH
jgi:hypothetical protein